MTLSLQGMQGAGFDPNYIKLFRLAQLIIEYLLVRSLLLIKNKIIACHFLNPVHEQSMDKNK